MNLIQIGTHELFPQLMCLLQTKGTAIVEKELVFQGQLQGAYSASPFARILEFLV
jgi:hypothetical protein